MPVDGPPYNIQSRCQIVGTIKSGPWKSIVASQLAEEREPTGSTTLQ